MRHRRLLAALLVPTGIVASHALGYLAAGTEPHVRAHAVGYLLADFGRLAALGAATVLLLLLLERREASMGLAAVTAAQCSVFAALEITEQASLGAPLADGLAQPGLRWGVLLQVAVAVIALLLARATKAIVRALRRRPPFPAMPDRAFALLPGTSWSMALGVRHSGRAPPLSRSAA